MLVLKAAVSHDDDRARDMEALLSDEQQASLYRSEPWSELSYTSVPPPMPGLIRNDRQHGGNVEVTHVLTERPFVLHLTTAMAVGKGRLSQLG